MKPLLTPLDEGVGGKFNTVAKKAPSDELGAERRTSMKGSKAR
jgi:hypothetical protein